METLPKEGIPPEIAHLVKISKEDNSLDRIQVQKLSNPVAGRCQNPVEASRIFEELAPNAIVCERSNEDGVDVIAQRAAAFTDIGAKLEACEASTKRKKPLKIAVSTGNNMMDQFKPWLE